MDNESMRCITGINTESTNGVTASSTFDIGFSPIRKKHRGGASKSPNKQPEGDNDVFMSDGNTIENNDNNNVGDNDSPIKQKRNRGGRNRFKNRRKLVEVNGVVATHENGNNNNISGDTNEIQDDGKFDECENGV